MRESAVIKLIELMDKRGDYEIQVYDLYVKTHKYQTKDLIEVAEGSDLLVLAVHHGCFKHLPLDDMVKVMRNRNLFDTRNFLNREEIESKGFKYILLGNGESR